ncbi:hypothetical protein DFR70_101614 [Nocardia tenerifensis]|uniref:Zn-dependent protease with chaperone function n=1 Tax=Nocardia tenerifensis TaxID=228006 RepID=A0A318KG12_9NOCA|nr:hypothetical protein [Nocardia tenerifensis]PXX71192.1 hypothetical protein DFR70_101614 [Nocardia tenerifensis]
MTSEVIAQANYPGGTAVARRSTADRVRAWIVLLLSALPSAAPLTVLLYGLGRALGLGAPGVLAVVWFVVCVCAGAVYFRGAEGKWLSRLSRLRTPTDEERAALNSAWARVTRQAGVDAASCSLWIPESDRRFVVPDRMLVVAPDALRLPPRELEAVLAHRLAQRVQGRAAFWQLVFRLYNLPVVWIERALLAGLGLNAIGEAIARRLPARGSRAFAVGWTVLSRVLVACPTVAAATVIVGLAPAVLLRVTPELAALAVRPVVDRVEYRTDRIVVDLGYGAELGGVLRADVPHPAHAPLDPLSVSLFWPNTASDKRIRRIRDRLDELARRWSRPAS